MIGVAEAASGDLVEVSAGAQATANTASRIRHRRDGLFLI
jgi:hypothetical protein